MRHQGVIASLRSWEARFPVHAWTVNGLHVWPLIRARLAQNLLVVGRPRRSKESAAQAARRVAALSADRFRQPSASTRRIACADVLVLTRPANRQLLQGRWFDRLFDPLTDVLEEAGWSVLHLEHRGDGAAYNTPRYRPALVTRPAVTRRNVLAALESVRSARLDAYDEFSSAVRHEQPIAAPSPLWIARRARSVERSADFFEGLLRRTRARVSMCSVYYTLVGAALCLASRRTGVPSVDVQHGVTLGNPAYEGWTRFPAGGYAVVPDIFWSWSEADAAPVEAWPDHVRPRHRVLIGGHPWMAFWESGRPLAASSQAQLPSHSSAGLTVLITLTWSSGLSAFLQQLIEAAPRDWTWWVRLHPLMNREREGVRDWCAHHAAGRAFVDEPSDLPLPLLLSHAHVHLTHNSTVVQEAARVGVPSVVVDDHALDVYPELQSGWAVFAATIEDAIAAVRSRPAAALALARPQPYPSWSDLTAAVQQLMASSSCPDTAAAASSRTPGLA